jgi:hypothetical protein
MRDIRIPPMQPIQSDFTAAVNLSRESSSTRNAKSQCNVSRRLGVIPADRELI